jgi:hemolysin activation/secretion protein
MAGSAQVVFQVAQGDIGQELQRLERGLREGAGPRPDRETPPQVITELEQRAAELETAGDEQADQLARDAEEILRAAEEEEAEAGAGMAGETEAAAEAAEEATASEEALQVLEESMAEDAEGGVSAVVVEESVPAETGAVDVPAAAVAEEEDAVVEPESGAAEPAVPTTATPRGRLGGSYDIERVTVEGDAALLESLGLMDQLREEVIGQTLTERQIRDIARNYNRLLVERGYYLSRVSTPPAAIRRLAEGELLLEVDQGRVGNTAFYQKRDGQRLMDGEEPVPYQGRWYSEKQLRRRLAGVETGAPFLYDDFYKSVFTVNSHPDLTMDTELKVRREREEGLQRRYVDMDFAVEDDIPIHGVFEIQNSGTDATEEWRAALTLQHLNLTKHDDVLTLTLPASLDFSTVRSVAASYYLPHYLGQGGAFTLYGGYSELSTEDLVPDIDLDGTGYFFGLQGSYDLIETDRHILKLSVGWAYQFIEDTLILGQELDTPREVTIAPFSFVASYSSVRPDALGGRNFLTSQTSVNIGGALGSSDDDEIALQRETAEADYYVERLQFARIQPLSFREPEPDEEVRQWILFGKLDGQIASGALIPAEQKAVGGLDNVRGYKEREVLGDHGVSGTLELRSPIYVGNMTSRWGETPDAAGGSERLQLVGFVDGAVMYIEDALEDQDDEFTLLSIGAGIRAAITRYTQFKFDWGFPIEETLESDSGGRGHVSFEVQI